MGVEIQNDIFLVRNRGWIWRIGWHPPPRIPRSTPQGLTVHLCLFECGIILLMLPSAILNGRVVFSIFITLFLPQPL